MFFRWVRSKISSHFDSITYFLDRVEIKFHLKFFPCSSLNALGIINFYNKFHQLLCLHVFRPCCSKSCSVLSCFWLCSPRLARQYSHCIHQSELKRFSLHCFIANIHSFEIHFTCQFRENWVSRSRTMRSPGIVLPFYLSFPLAVILFDVCPSDDPHEQRERRGNAVKAYENRIQVFESIFLQGVVMQDPYFSLS